MKEQRKYVSYDTKFHQAGLDVLNMILLTEIENLNKLPGGCYVSDEQLGKLIMIGRSKTNERIKYLEKLGFIKCQTRFENGKRKRFISFLTDKVKLPQGNTTQRMRKKIVELPLGNTVQLPQGNPTLLPQGNNNKLYEEVNEKKKSIEDPYTGTINTGPDENFVDVISIKTIPTEFSINNTLSQEPIGITSNYDDLQIDGTICITSTEDPIDITSTTKKFVKDQRIGSPVNRLNGFRGLSISKFCDQLDPEKQMDFVRLPMVQKLIYVKNFNNKKDWDPFGNQSK
jgi:hypothetical protein